MNCFLCSVFCLLISASANLRCPQNDVHYSPPYRLLSAHFSGVTVPSEQFTKLENDLHLLLALCISENSIAVLKVSTLLYLYAVFSLVFFYSS